jgi:hypothetical protein
MSLRLSRLPFSLLLLAGLIVAAPATAQNALRGKALYTNTNGAPISCANTDCHGPDPRLDNNNILNGANNPTAIQQAIAGDVPEMGFLAAYVSSQDRLDLAAYLANPNVTAAPGIAIAPASVTFASISVGSASAVAAVTVTNNGTANLVLSSRSISGAQASQFRIETSSTCGNGTTLVPNASCRINVTFRPTSTGAKSAAIAIAHSAPGGSSSIPLSGTATAPSIALSPASITFPATIAGSASAVFSVTAANNGSAPLSFSAIALSGANATQFRIEPTSTCSIASSVAAGSSCRVALTYRPTVLGPVTASLVFTHNAAGGSSSVALNGTGTPAPTPTISLSANALTFAPQEVGTQSALRTITMTNVGNAALNISGLTLGGTHAAEFARSGTCQSGMSLAASGGSCTLVFSFRPTAIGTRTASLTVASNNAGGNVTISLTGSATTNTPAAVVSPTTLTFGSQQIGTTSAAQVVSVRNGGGGRLTVSSVSITGSHFRQSGNCVGASLTVGQTCAINVVFAPTAAGSLAATLSIAHGAAGSPSRVALTGAGTTLPVPIVQATPLSVNFPGITVVGQPSAIERITITNAGPGSVTLAATTTSSAEFVIVAGAAGACATGQVLAQGASCTLDVGFSPSAPGARAGSVRVSSNGTPATLTVALAGDAAGVAAPEITADRTALDFGQVPMTAQSPAEPVMLSNTGSTNLNVTEVTVGAPFQLVPGGSCGVAPFVLAPGESCAIQVQFAPAAPGSHTAILSISSNAGVLAVSLAGEALGVAAAPAPGSAVSPMNTGGGGGSFDPAILLLLGLLLSAASALRPACERKKRTS